MKINDIIILHSLFWTDVYFSEAKKVSGLEESLSALQVEHENMKNKLESQIEDSSQGTVIIKHSL